MKTLGAGGISQEDWLMEMAQRIAGEARGMSATELRRQQRRRQKLVQRGLVWVTGKKGWCCRICQPGHLTKIGSWTKAWSHLKRDKHVEIEMMEKLSR